MYENLDSKRWIIVLHTNWEFEHHDSLNCKICVIINWLVVFGHLRHDLSIGSFLQHKCKETMCWSTSFIYEPQYDIVAKPIANIAQESWFNSTWGGREIYPFFWCHHQEWWEILMNLSDEMKVRGLVSLNCWLSMREGNNIGKLYITSICLISVKSTPKSSNGI